MGSMTPFLGFLSAVLGPLGVSSTPDYVPIQLV